MEEEKGSPCKQHAEKEDSHTAQEEGISSNKKIKAVNKENSGNKTGVSSVATGMKETKTNKEQEGNLSKQLLEKLEYQHTTQKLDTAANDNDQILLQSFKASTEEARKVCLEQIRPWTKREERNHRIKMALLRVLCASSVRRRLDNDRAARQVGFCPNKRAMSLQYNCPHATGTDALSLEQRISSSEEALSSLTSEGKFDPTRVTSEMIEKHRRDLELLPVALWSMGKSFHLEDSREKWLILREARYHKYVLNKHEEGARKSNRKTPHQEILSKELESAKDDRSYGLIAWSLPLPFLLGAASGFWRQDRFLALSYFLGCPLLDRTGTLNDGLGIKLVNLHPIPDFDMQRFAKFGNKTNEILSSIILERAREAISLCHERGNKEISIQWSGGIDTTSVVCAFLQATENNPDDRALLVIYYQERSVAEYPAFFRDVVVKLKHRIIQGHVRDLTNLPPICGTDSDESDIPLVVTGDPADMLFGTFRMAGALVGGNAYEGESTKGGHKRCRYSLEERWQDRVPILLHERRLLFNTRDYHSVPIPTWSPVYKIVASEWVQWMTRQVIKAPIPIETMFDWWYWITYSCKYNHDVHRIYYNRREIPTKLRKRIFNFYDSPGFHQYSFALHQDKMKDKRVWSTYKHSLKKFILEYCQSQGLAPPKSEELWQQRRPKSSPNDPSSTIPDDHTVYYHTKIKVPSVSNSWGMEVGIDSNWNVIKFGACSISLKAWRYNYFNVLLQQALLTEAAKIKVLADQKFIRGNWHEARALYLQAQGENYRDSRYRGWEDKANPPFRPDRIIDCTSEIRLCYRGYNRSKSDKKPLDTARGEEDLRNRQVRAISSTRTWNCHRAYMTMYGGYGGE